MGRYTVQYEPDEDGWWIAQLAEDKDVATRGCSIDQARTRIRVCMRADGYEDADEAELVDEVAVAPSIRASLSETRRHGLSVRDAARILGVSHQRVQQLVSGK